MGPSTRQYFGTDGIRGAVGKELIHPEFILKLGWAAGKVLAKQGQSNTVLIGKDTRISGYMLESALEAGLSAAGVDISLLGPMPTPAIAYLTCTLRASAGIVISASHNPYSDNGIKFFSADGRKLPDHLEEAIEQQLQKKMVTVSSNHLGKAKRIIDAPGRYIEFCKSTIPAKFRLTGMKIVVDCANGATYHIAPNVFRELGAEVIEVAVTPDGLNINEACGSTCPQTLQARVLQENADLGIALDGDGDRVIMVDEKGRVIDGDELLYLIAQHRVERQHMQGGVVGTSMTNLGIERAIRGLGLDFVRSQVGDRYIIAELKNRGWQLGGESSGHILCLDKTTTGDGIIAALQILYATVYRQTTLSDMCASVEKMPQSKINIQNSDYSMQALQSVELKDKIRDIEAKLNGHGRVLLRPSGTEPVIRLMVEGEDSKQIDSYAKQIAQWIKTDDKRC